MGGTARTAEYISLMRSILLIDHGSVKPEANHMVSCMANLLQHVVGDDILVRHAHMELAEPSIAAGFADCVQNGATEVIAFPYMLSPGKHVTRDVPRLVAEAAQAFPQVSYRVTGAFGVHDQNRTFDPARCFLHIDVGSYLKQPDGGIGTRRGAHLLAP